MTSTMFDAAIIGGSFAGNSAALLLARGRARVALFDTGQPRNRFATEGHGFIGMDGRPPLVIQKAAQADALKYPNVSLFQTAAQTVTPTAAGFDVFAEEGTTVAARQLILAHGNRDMPPDIPGLRECWGRSVLQCPYCHGFEVADRPTGVLLIDPMQLHQVQILRNWTADLVVFTNMIDLPPKDRDDLRASGVRIVDGAVERVEQEGGQVRAVCVDGQDSHEIDVLYTASRTDFAAPFANLLGCDVLDGPFGPYLGVDAMQRTNIEKVYAAGDITRPMYNATFAAADGARAAMACHQSLLVDQGLLRTG